MDPRPVEFRLDASDWQTRSDFYDALRIVLGVPDWHGSSIDAFVDTMIYGDFNDLKPPYTLIIGGWKQAPLVVQHEIRLFVSVLIKHGAKGRSPHDPIDLTISY